MAGLRDWAPGAPPASAAAPPCERLWGSCPAAVFRESGFAAAVTGRDPGIVIRPPDQRFHITERFYWGRGEAASGVCSGMPS